MRKIRCPVKRVDHPAVWRSRANVEADSSFLGERPMAGEVAANEVDDALFRRMVCIGDEVDGILALNVKSRPRILEENFAGSGGRLYRHCEQTIGRRFDVIGIPHRSILTRTSLATDFADTMQRIFLCETIDLLCKQAYKAIMLARESAVGRAHRYFGRP